ncbi:Flp pilus assembly protein CpaB [Nocardioides alpinus]|uniref:Pilus assembly protein CpaB n=1 Tax=Nocardioides alpinus TaxID=748909 RepID=A0A1I0W106_9ACTN|nr:SAF domain-containing protein [Nocardioides alpinus]PKH37609.1 pilus assembly protein CpaB [Nocardioides alpinus]SFA82214.1 Flp pilus assembly protein CpaB [Nocardioides alpinus]
MFPGLPPTRRRLRAVRHQLRRRRRLIAAALAAAAVVSALRTLAPPPPDTVDVLVATRDLPSGTLLDDDDLVVRAFPADLAPAGAASAAAGRVLAAPIGRGEVLTDVRVVGPALAMAQPGETVVPVRLPDAGMATLLRPGDEVDLVATDPGTGTSVVVARDVTVLATPTGAPDGPAGGSGGALVVIGASAEEAIAISSAALAQFLTVSWER